LLFFPFLTPIFYFFVQQDFIPL